MRHISPEIKALLKNNDISELRHKLLLYRRKWYGSAYAIETEAVDITDNINYKNADISITQQLDNDEANVWKTGSLTLTLYNKENQFWQDKEDGLFPGPYIIYGSKIEYYIGSPALNDYVKCFTGYITELPNYRQDEGLIELRVLNRLDWLKTISAENVSTKITGEQLIEQDLSHCITANAAAGRIQRILRGETLADAIELTEKTDYSISQLNDYDNGAIIELKSDLLSNENIYADYIYWRKGIMIDELVNELLDVSGIDTGHRIVDPVKFQNNARITVNAYALSFSARLNYIVDGTNINYNNNSASNIRMSNGKVIDVYNKGGNLTLWLNSRRYLTSETRTEITFTVSGDIYRLQAREDVSDGIISAFQILKNGVQVFRQNNMYESSDGGLLVKIDLSDGVKIYADGINNLRYSDGAGIKTLTNIVSTFTTGDILSYIEFRGFQTKNGNIIEQSGFEIEDISIGNGISWFQFLENHNISGVPNFTFTVNGNEVYNNAAISGTEDILLFFKNTSGKGNNISFNSLQLTYLQPNNIQLGVCNLTNMSVFQALQELASLSMYEIGFDYDDKFFFRSREKTAEFKTLTDNEIISISKAQNDISRLKNRVVVAYGEYTKIVDGGTQNEPPPNNNDKYGERTYEISGSQLLPADNVDLAYAIAPTIYAELSKLRLNLTVDTVIDLELELGDYVRILHNNNLFSKVNFTDFTKRKETGTYYMKCKVRGIKTSFIKRRATLELVDYTSETDIPAEQGKAFMYRPQESFDLQK